MGKFSRTILCCIISFLKTLGWKMRSFFVLATLALAVKADTKVFPAGVDKAQLVTAPAGFPQPVINNENVAPILNTVPAQTRAHEEHLQIAMQQQLQQMEAQQQIQIMQQQQEIAAARHFGRL